MVEFAGEGGENVDKFSFSVLKGIGKRPAVTIKELAAIYNRSVDYMEDPVLYLRRCGYLDIERNYAALHDLTENSLIGRDTPLTISYGGRIAIECERKERRQSSFNEFRAWFTLAIAFAALIVSVVALQC